MTEDKGLFSSPFFPSNYPPSTSCVWNIEVSPQDPILISFPLKIKKLRMKKRIPKNPLIVHWPWHPFSQHFLSNYIRLVFDFQVAKEKFVKVDFKKFFVGNQSEHCPHDYVDINGERWVSISLRLLLLTLYIICASGGIAWVQNENCRVLSQQIPNKDHKSMCQKSFMTWSLKLWTLP